MRAQSARARSSRRTRLVRATRYAIGTILITVAALSASGEEPSVCFGTTADGRLKNGWELPASGSNYSTHWQAGRVLNRSFVHSSVHAVVLEAYAELQVTMPGTIFVYGETGWKYGGEFKPHKTHRNGLSVDFMVPVLNEDDESVALPSSVINRWGYGHDFDESGRKGKLRIDFDAIAEHVYQLHVSATKHDIDIWRVIFDPALQPYLRGSPRWEYLDQYVQFSTRPSWVRHDEHYHVDFDVQCEPRY